MVGRWIVQTGILEGDFCTRQGTCKMNSCQPKPRIKEAFQRPEINTLVSWVHWKKEVLDQAKDQV